MLRKIAGMPPNVIAEKALRRSIRIIDLPLSLIEEKSSGIKLTERSTYADRRVLREFRQCLRNGDSLVVYDIGANRGDYARSLAKSASVKNVIAFEPLPTEFEALQLTTKSCAKIKAINLALGNESGKISFHQNAFSASSSVLPMLPEHVRQYPFTADSNEIQVPISRLDDAIREMNLPLPDLIKIDVQGYEDRVISGGTNALYHAQWIALELSFVPLYQGSGDFDELYRIVFDRGFRLVEITNQGVGADGTPLQINALFKKGSSRIEK